MLVVVAVVVYDVDLFAAVLSLLEVRVRGNPSEGGVRAEGGGARVPASLGVFVLE